MRARHRRSSEKLGEASRSSLVHFLASPRESSSKVRVFSASSSHSCTSSTRNLHLLKLSHLKIIDRSEANRQRRKARSSQAVFMSVVKKTKKKQQRGYVVPTRSRVPENDIKIILRYSTTDEGTGKSPFEEIQRLSRARARLRCRSRLRYFIYLYTFFFYFLSRDSCAAPNTCSQRLLLRISGISGTSKVNEGFFISHRMTARDDFSRYLNYPSSMRDGQAMLDDAQRRRHEALFGKDRLLVTRVLLLLHVVIIAQRRLHAV